MLATYRTAAALIIPVLAGLLFAACFESADPRELSCTQNQYCPQGYVCVGALMGSPGKCQKPAATDALVSAYDTAVGDDVGDEDAFSDGALSSSGDGGTSAGDVAEALDQSASVDANGAADRSPEVHIPVD